MHPLSPLALCSIFTPFGPSGAYGHPVEAQDGDVLSVTLPPDSGVHGTLTVHRVQMAEYLKSEVGIDVEKLHRHQEPLINRAGQNYTFPEGSGAEGVLSWDPTTGGTEKAVSVPYRQHMTCDSCWGLCAIPFIGPSM
ncbi:hypothetical protein GGR53DRAFT_445091 [Hypoxylon sp. FL1150]|nr:hypothetical protein GGR53DRAFT_445091 [Hypoxylon sp. FL1150]